MEKERNEGNSQLVRCSKDTVVVRERERDTIQNMLAGKRSDTESDNLKYVGWNEKQRQIECNRKRAEWEA